MKGLTTRAAHSQLHLCPLYYSNFRSTMVSFTKPQHVSQVAFKLKLKPNLRAKIFTLTSLSGWHFISKMFSQEALVQLTRAPNVASGLSRAQEWCASVGSGGGLRTETAAAGAAVTVAVLLLAPHCSQDEVHRCSHSVQGFIGRLKQCISVKSNSS